MLNYVSQRRSVHLSLDKVLPNGFQFWWRSPQDNHIAAGIFLWRPRNIGCTMGCGTLSHSTVWVNSQSEFSRCKHIINVHTILGKLLQNILFFRKLNVESTIWVSSTGSSVINNTRSRLTLANTIISLNSSVQYGFTERPSTRDRSPPVKNYNPKMKNSLTCTVFHFPNQRSTACLAHSTQTVCISWRPSSPPNPAASTADDLHQAAPSVLRPPWSHDMQPAAIE